jgi:Ca2+-binding RTX toxin-like protein
MTRIWFPCVAVLTVVAGCQGNFDDGVVLGCFGLVNQTIQGTDVFSDQIVTNSYFGGCSQDDSGMQIVERATPAAAGNQDAMTAQCNSDCQVRLNAYAGARPDISLPLSCQTFFAIPCDSIGADASNVGPNGAAFQAGGPADTRYKMTGTVTLTVNNGVPTPVNAHGIVDGTMVCAANASCGFTLSRLDVVSDDQNFPFASMTVDSAHVQNQGLISGNHTATNMVINQGTIEAEVSASVGGVVESFHVRNTNQPVQLNATNPTLDRFLAPLDVTLTGSGNLGNVTVHIVMNGTPDQHRPVAAITALQTSYECTCKSCTPASFASAATDQDNDLQSLSWKLDNQFQVADGSSAPQQLDLELPLGPHTVTLVATDTRGAASSATQSFNVVDTTPPVLTVPPDITLRACDIPNIGTATASDTCSEPVVITNNSPGSFPVGTTIVTWTADDAQGVEATATQRVTVTSVSNSAACCPAGYHVIVITANNATTNGTSGNDCIIGTGTADIINGLGGDDIIIGGDGNDVIDGGDGNDIIIAGGGQDTITGGNGNDTIYAGEGDDIVNAGAGDDIIYGNGGQDKIVPGPGNDFVDGGPGDDQINGGTGTAAQIAANNQGDDVLIGGTNNDTIVDNVGNNTIEGVTGDDHLTGGPGNDTIIGGAGHDQCVSGGGSDNLICHP